MSELPRKVREARKRFLALRHAARKQDRKPAAATRKAAKISRGAHKIEQREAFLRAILHASRDALKRNGVWGGHADVAGTENVPLVQVESKEGKFSKFETSLARTVARRVQSDEKRAERGKEGKGKWWKKRERSERQERIVDGISGFVRRSRNG